MNTTRAVQSGEDVDGFTGEKITVYKGFVSSEDYRLSVEKNIKTYVTAQAQTHTEKTVVRLADENGELEPGIVNPSPQFVYRSSYSYDTKNDRDRKSVV